MGRSAMESKSTTKGSMINGLGWICAAVAKMKLLIKNRARARTPAMRQKQISCNQNQLENIGVVGTTE
jgi:hypothetical protein